MGNKKNTKLVYAQSSDIKARTYIEYKKDMKKKAIVELEIKDWLNNSKKTEILKYIRNILKNGIPESILKKWKEIYNRQQNLIQTNREKFEQFTKNILQELRSSSGDNLIIEKYGGDKFLWFQRKGGITREPDYVVNLELKSYNKIKPIVIPIFHIEFQYADKEDLDYYDFKISKVAKKIKGNRVPHKDRIFLYILKNSSKYAFMEPGWIVKHGKIGVVPAWGSRQAYRIAKDDFEKIFKKDRTLKPVIINIDNKINILNFQHQLVSIWENEFSKNLQKVIDKKKLVKITPNNLNGFFKVCFILEHLNKTPENINLWFVYLLSYVNDELTLKDISILTYSLDFLYSKIPHSKLKSNELEELINKIKIIIKTINNRYNDDGFYRSSVKESPLEETRFALFSINLIEDIIQDVIYYHNADLEPITKIYQYVKNPKRISNIINNESL
ncbi:hypothetical protein DRQ26_02310 [bacterium]|nr:MAG: hypothetical protein DRQ26_02310 [bacterium]